MSNASSSSVSSFLYNATLQNGASSWAGLCIAELNAAPNGTWLEHLVNEKGQHVAGLSSKAWGITLAMCEEYCNGNAIPYSFDFGSFSSSMTNYFLPWLSLTAQLPFETDDLWNDATAFCLAVGSPTLVTYSLTITILNRYWVRRKFHELRRSMKEVGKKLENCGKWHNRFTAIEYLLQEGQQVPLRASQERGWLSSLIVAPENDEWWEDLYERLETARRGVTASLIAQMGLAFIAFLLTVIASFRADLGNPDVALNIASGTLWIWLIPVILGWIVVGTQKSRSSIEIALTQRPAYRALEAPYWQNGEKYEQATQKGLVMHVGLNPQPSRTPTAAGPLDVEDHRKSEVRKWLGLSVSGHERLRGPIFNYARIFTWWQVAHSLDEALDTVLRNIGTDQATSRAGPRHPGRERWDITAGNANLQGNCEDTADFCGLGAEPYRVLAYPRWRSVPSTTVWRMVQASLVALLVQWGTTGGSILIAYLTPTIGLGCRSGGYTLYGLLGTAAWLCLLISMLVSHEVMLRYQERQLEDPSTDFREKKRHVKGQIGYDRDWAHSALCGVAVTLRCLGQFLAVLNTGWLIVSSLMEFMGFFDNCWCQGVVLGLHKHGWIVLFKGAAQLRAAAELPWAGGLFVALFACAVSAAFFVVFSYSPAPK